MGRKCTVPECLSEEGREEDRGVTFHKIPLHSDIRPKWMALCRIPEDKHSVKVVHVCSRHFLKANFCLFKGKRYMLRQGVLPSVFPWSKLKKEASSSAEEDGGATKEDMKDKSPQSSSKMDKSSPEGFCDIKEEIVGTTGESVIMNDEGNVMSFPVVNLDSAKNVKKPEPIQQQQLSTTTIEQTEDSFETASGVINFNNNTRLEALDFNQVWLPARIIEIDYEDKEVLIHFEKYSSKYDEWINMNSSRLRPIQPLQTTGKKGTVAETYIIGEKCMASWSDARKFPATVTKIFDRDTYEVCFNDGLYKVLKAHRMAKAGGKLGTSPLFDPAQGTKQQRREKKRKINVVELFRKRARVDNAEETTSEDVEVSSPIEEPEPWIPKWENGRPVGVDSTIETSDGMKKSIVVADPRLPPNWQKHLMQKTHGVAAGKWETIILSSEGRRFRNRSEIKAFLEENPQLNYSEGLFDFSMHRRTRATRSSIALSETPTTTATERPETESQTEEETSSTSLKIPIVDDVYKCPIEGCGKNFRRENLAQMHVKHYHPKFTKYLDSTPNVADLAYARTVGESLDKSPDRSKLSQPRQTKNVTPKIPTPKTSINQSPAIEAETKQAILDAQANHLQRTKDSEILKLLNSKPPEMTLPKYPPGLPSNMYPDFKLKDLLNKSEGIPKREDLNLKSLSASTARPTGIKTLLPVVRSTEKKELDPDKADNKAIKTNKQIVKRKRPMSENVEMHKPVVETPILTTAIKQEVPSQSDPMNYIVEGGEVIKIVRMKREEIINCTCGVTEEDGLMIQCEVCFCWQHAYCNNIQYESQVPDKYICLICQNPVRQRSSRKYFHDQDWLKNGTLPVASYHCKDEEVLKRRFEKLKKSHDLTGGLYELKDYMNSLKVKLKIAEAKNHPKLYLWSKPWEKYPLPEKMDLVQANEETKSKYENELSKSDIDLLTNKNDSMLLSILKSAKEEQKLKDDLDLNTLIGNNLDQLPVPTVPQPEAAIETTDCKLNLLEHIAHCQTLVEERLDDFLAQTETLDGVGLNNTEEDFIRAKQTVQMLLRDLGTLKDLSQSSNL